MTPLPPASRSGLRAGRISEMLTRSNPLLGLSVRQAQSLYDAARVSRGSLPLLQRVYAEIEAVDPVLCTCVERRSAAISRMGWTVDVVEGADADSTLADEQRDAVTRIMSGIDNLSETIEHLGLAFFRGYSFAAPVWHWRGDGVEHIDLLQSYNCLYDAAAASWMWNPDCQDDAHGLEPIGDEVLRVICERPIDYPAMFVYLRHALAERDWGRYVERYGIPPVDAVMSPASTDIDRPAYEMAADAARDGMSVVWPSGTTVSRADSSRGADPFSLLIEHQERLLVLMATGGTLTSLAQADTGTLAGGAQMDVWREIVAHIAVVISAAINRGIVGRYLDAVYPGRPHLVRYAIGRQPPPSAQDVLAMAGAAKTAGYILSQEDLERGTGMRYERDAAATPLPQAGGYAGLPGIVTNAGEPGEEAPDDGRSDALRAASADFAAVREAVDELLSSSEDEAPAKAGELAGRLPELLPRRPALADAMQQAMVDGVVDGILRSAGAQGRKDPSSGVARPLQNAPSAPDGKSPAQTPEARKSQN